MHQVTPTEWEVTLACPQCGHDAAVTVLVLAAADTLPSESVAPWYCKRACGLGYEQRAELQDTASEIVKRARAEWESAVKCPSCHGEKHGDRDIEDERYKGGYIAQLVTCDVCSGSGQKVWTDE